MKYSIYDVAKKAGVSVVTVSKVLNQVPTVKECNRLKVMKAIEDLDYVPSQAARSLAKGRTNVVGLILPELNDPFLMEIVQTVEQELAKRDYFLAISVATEDKKYEIQSQFFFQADRVDGILLLTPLYEKEYIEFLKRKEIPFIIMDNQLYPFTEPSVVIDNFKGGYEAGHYLYEAGYEKIAHIGGPHFNLAATERLKGFCKALEEVGKEPYLMDLGYFEIETGFKVMTRWIEEGQMPDAVFAADDHIALGVIDALKLKGYKVPEDVGVIGFDDHPFSSKLHPYLTTFKQPAAQMGKKGVELLVKVMKGKQKISQVTKLDPILVERESVLRKE